MYQVCICLNLIIVIDIRLNWPLSYLTYKLLGFQDTCFSIYVAGCSLHVLSNLLHPQVTWALQ